ncbi:hypothetical protein [Pseudorhodoferax sp.]|uniref:hypothetical protein n=1 Tax=Pseudorhodoferax sp. TaxID=1993553 RepID=UPI002DD696FE|nr:hypothetical protein [Pseudorhodoferax sp.]
MPLARCACAAFLAALMATLAPAAGAADLSPDGASATLVVAYTLVGKGDEIPASRERHVTWSVDDGFEVRATLKAQKASGHPSLHKAGAADQARQQQRMDAAQAAVASQADLMAAAQKAAEKCGDNQACLMAEVQKMTKMVDPAKTKAAQEQMAIATAQPAARYQIFSGTTQQASFRINEHATEAYFDAACSLKNEASCRIDTTVKGSGATTDGNGKTTTQTGAFAEIDAQAGTLVLMLPTPLLASADQVVQSASGQRQSGQSKVTRSVHTDHVKEAVRVSCGDCKSASGKYTREIKDTVVGRPATLTVSWTFTRP